MPTDEIATAWLETALGRRCLANEQRLVRQALDRVFGEQLLQIGSWGGRESFLRYARTQHESLVGLRPEDRGADFIAAAQELPVATGVIDAVLVPHTLELVESPHALLREADRVLRADGQLIVLGFVPSGPWGLRHLLARDGYPPGHRRMIRERRLRDWLALLSFEVESVTPCCHTFPFERIRRLGTLPRERWAERWLPFLAGSYMLSAQKRVQGMTPIRPGWKRPRLRAVGGLVEPTTRASPTPGVVSGK